MFDMHQRRSMNKHTNNVTNFHSVDKHRKFYKDLFSVPFKRFDGLCFCSLLCFKWWLLCIIDVDQTEHRTNI